MGRRSRKRGAGDVAAGDRPDDGRPASAGPSRRASRRARLDEAPRPPWAPVPLTEICILGGGILLVVGLVGGGSSRALLLGFGFALVFLATVELTLREHLAGYRSHSVLLAGCAAAATLAILVLATGFSRPLLVGVAAIVFALVLIVMRKIFASRSGGMSWRA